MAKEQKQPQGLKGFFTRAGKSFYDGGLFATTTSTWMAKWAGKIGFVIATTSMVVLMPLLFEIGREGQMLESERSQVKDMRNRGYSDRQLQEMGFSESSVHSPSVSLK
eukprot:CAMPEP_0119009070 /NCGR_PEP_ID=MMETSP1176-20130426/4122_1 /TAXON_ID=265551 /ORGANISM="Synedropsis recta cf, Strain CCMP1620" /LENGTH=107 /DNA_ID=CAMNT_0006961515 /DNA_START=74 /DNA_END=397 /DNA_ORIENTATION=-